MVEVRSEPQCSSPRAAAVTIAALAAAASLGAVAPRGAAAQADSVAGRPVVIGSLEDTRRRDRQLLGEAAAEGTLLRSASSGGSLARRGADGVRLLAPDVRAVWNGALPFSLNDGALWAGRGWSGLARAGLDARRGRVRVLLLPEVAVSENRAFDVPPNRRAGRSEYAWPWSEPRFDIDLPSRFGDRAWRLLSLGQSAVSVDAGAVTVGVSTENEWWGPGVRNALVLSNNAEGAPHAFVRTARPIRTRLGTVEARWQLGVLTPSLFADSVPERRWRAMSALAATLRPAALPGVTFGVARAVVTDVDDRRSVASHALDAIARWSAAPVNPADRPAADQLTSLSVRWIIAPTRTEVYAEWGRQGTPRSLRELLVAPHDAGALTLGLQSLQPLGTGGRSRLRLQAEATSVEQSVAFRDRPAPNPFYTGLAARDGYTHRGQVLGAAIGPGGSSQWVAADLVRAAGEVGLFVGRVRWNNDALYRTEQPNFFRHDVSTFLGARAVRRTRLADVGVESYWARRYNYLFQNGFVNPGGRRTVDVTNVTAALSVTPRR